MSSGRLAAVTSANRFVAISENAAAAVSTVVCTAPCPLAGQFVSRPCVELDDRIVVVVAVGDELRDHGATAAARHLVEVLERRLELRFGRVARLAQLLDVVSDDLAVELARALVDPRLLRLELVQLHLHVLLLDQPRRDLLDGAGDDLQPQVLGQRFLGRRRPLLRVLDEALGLGVLLARKV